MPFDNNMLAQLAGFDSQISAVEHRIARDKARLRTLRLRVRWAKIDAELEASIRAENAMEDYDTAARIRDVYRAGHIGKVDAVKALRSQCDMGLSDGVRYLGE